MKKQIICLLLALLLFLSACQNSTPQETEGDFLFYYPAQDISYQGDGAVCSQSAGFDAAAVETEELLLRYFASIPPENGVPPLPEQWNLRSAVLENATAVVILQGSPASALERSVSATCIAMTLLQLDAVQRVSITVPGESEPLLLSENDIFLYDTGMLPQEEMLTLYFPDAQRRYLVRETLSVEAMSSAEKPAYIVSQLLAGRERGQLTSCIPEGTELLDISVENGICTVDLSSEFQSELENSFAAERMAVYSIVNSLTELPEISTVDLWVAGAPIEKLYRMELLSGISRDENLISLPASKDLLDVTLYPTCGDDGLLVAVPQLLALDGEHSTAELLMQALIAFDGTNGLQSCLPAGTKLLSLRLEGGNCVVDLTREFLDGCANAEEETLAVRSIVATMCGLPEINTVEILVEGIEPTFRDETLRTIHRTAAHWFAD